LSDSENLSFETYSAVEEVNQESDLTPSLVNRVSELTEARYSQRYGKLGQHIRTLGWGSIEQQHYRFQQTLDCGIEFQGASVLDIGCGFADYYAFLVDEQIGISHYTGWDLNENFVEDAAARFAHSCVEIHHGNVLEVPDQEPIADIGVMLGLLNYNWHEQADNLAYTRQAMKNAFRLVRKALIVDFLSSCLCDAYPAEDFVYYHNPSDVLSFALKMTPSVMLKHDYTPIPQREFMVVLQK